MQMKTLFSSLRALRKGALYLLVAASVSAAGLVSCDDDGDDTGIDSGAPFTGVWVMTHIEITDEEGTDGGDTSGLGTVSLTLSEDNTFVYEVDIPGDEEEEPESYTDRGTWAWANPVLTLNYGDYRSQFKVLTWTKEKLVTEQSEDGETERRTWKKK